MKNNQMKEIYEQMKEMEEAFSQVGIIIGGGSIGQKIENNCITQSYKVPLGEGETSFHFTIRKSYEIDDLMRLVNGYANNDVDVRAIMKFANKLGITNAIVKEVAGIPTKDQEDYLNKYDMNEKDDFILCVISCMRHFHTFCKCSTYIKKKKNSKEEEAK